MELNSKIIARIAISGLLLGLISFILSVFSIYQNSQPPVSTDMMYPPLPASLPPPPPLPDYYNGKPPALPGGVSADTRDIPKWDLDIPGRFVLSESQPYYAFDENSIYYEDKQLSIADPKSFVVLNGYNSPSFDEVYDLDKFPIYSYDNKHFYKNAEIIGDRTDKGIRVFDNQYILIGDELFGDGHSDYEKRELGRNIIKDTTSLEYLGEGFFRDRFSVYSMAWPQNTECSYAPCPGVREFIQNANPEEFSVIEREEAIINRSDYESIAILGGTYQKSDIEHLIFTVPYFYPYYIEYRDAVYVLMTPIAIVGDQLIEKISEADTKTFNLVNNYYAKDNTNVFFIGQTNKEKIASVLEGANPQNFIITDTPFISTSGDRVYYKSTWLEGVNPANMIMERDGFIIRDGEVVWFITGTCHTSDMRKGTVSEIENYTPPC